LIFFFLVVALLLVGVDVQPEDAIFCHEEVNVLLVVVSIDNYLGVPLNCSLSNNPLPKHVG
jgi:hypothetical protein